MSSVTTKRTNGRVVHVPLQTLDKCCMCSSTTGLNLCSSCGEYIYCSTECQKADWKDHKKICGKGKTQRLDLYSFWPFLAYLAEVTRLNPKRPEHPALRHEIINKPVPNTKSQVLPDGTATNLVLLGDQLEPRDLISPRGGPSGKWWPSAATESIRNKLFFRIAREGYVLPTCISICFALLAEMYTTTYDPDFDLKNADPDQLNQRVRLECERSPIADFGICKGRAEVKPQDTFGYLVPNTFTGGGVDFFRGQDPKDHYWIYFKTLKGEEFLLDLSMFTFNFCMVVADTKPYMPNRPNYPPANLHQFAGYFLTREMRHSHPSIHYEKQRFSVMHNKALQGIVRKKNYGWGEVEKRILTAFMEHVAGHKMDEVEKELVVEFTLNNMFCVQDNLIFMDYMKYPKLPVIGIATDPGELDEGVPDSDDEDAWDYISKLNRKQRKGKISTEQLSQAFRKWNELRPEEKGKHGLRRKKH